MFIGGAGRGTAFNRDFLSQWDTEHAAAMGEGTKPANGGYPDCGQGIYSEKLAYKDWVQFNLNQRAHKNFIENLASFCFTIIAVGIAMPKVACV